MIDLGESPDGGQILGRALEHARQLGLRPIKVAEFDERASKGHAGGKVFGMKGEARAAGVNRFLESARAPALFGELGERNRRRVLLNPAPQIVNARIFGHAIERMLDVI